MAVVRVDGEDYPLEEGETVLDGLDRHGVNVPSSCRSGVCQSCLVRVTSGAPTAESQKGLVESLRVQDYMLACQCVPEDDLEISLDPGALRHDTVVRSVHDFGDGVYRVRLTAPNDFTYRAGQFVNVIGPGGDSRSYSLASVPGLDTHLELHVRRIPGGMVSPWLCDEVQPGDNIEIRGPQGKCFYTNDAAEKPLLLAGTGTGLAPLYGILRDAVNQGHQRDIHLFHGSIRPSGLYMRDALERWAADHPQVHYYPCALEAEGPAVPDDQTHIGPLDAYIQEAFPDLSGWRAYLCGHPDLVKVMQKKVFLAGVSLSDVFADAFLPSSTPAATDARAQTK